MRYTKKDANEFKQWLYSSDEAAAVIGVAPITIKKSRCSGLLLGKPAPEFLKMGRLIRYKRSVIHNWINQFSSFRTTLEANEGG